jgi:hypothetical protein
MGKRPFIWKELTIQFDGRTITGFYAEWKGIVVVKTLHGMKSIKSGGASFRWQTCGSTTRQPLVVLGVMVRRCCSRSSHGRGEQ